MVTSECKYEIEYRYTLYRLLKSKVHKNIIKLMDITFPTIREITHEDDPIIECLKEIKKQLLSGTIRINTQTRWLWYSILPDIKNIKIRFIDILKQKCIEAGYFCIIEEHDTHFIFTIKLEEEENSTDIPPPYI